jgi:hypothetical protein
LISRRHTGLRLVVPLVLRLKVVLFGHLAQSLVIEDRTSEARFNNPPPIQPPGMAMTDSPLCYNICPRMPRCTK